MTNVNALKSQAAKLVVKGNYAKALGIYSKVKEMDPGEPSIYNLIGDVLLKKGKKEKAIAEFGKALELYKKVQYYPNAIAVCKKIIRTDKEQALVYKDLADLYVQRGFIGEAVINYLEYASRMRKDGNKNEEIETYKKVIELGPSKIDIRQRLVDLYIAEGENQAAVEELEKLEELLIQKGEQAKLPEIEEKLANLKVEGIATETKEKKELTVKQGFTVEDMMTEGTKIEKKEEKVKPEQKLEEKEVREKAEEETISLEEELKKLEAVKRTSEHAKIDVDNLPPPGKSELQAAPTQWTNFEELGDLCLSVNSKNEAIDYFYKATQQYLEENNYEGAINLFKRIIEIRPLELRPRQKLIEISLKKDDKNSAAEWNLDLGRCLYKKGAIEEADKAFGRALNLSHRKEKIKKQISEIKGEEEKKPEMIVQEPSISLGELLEEEKTKSGKFSVAEEIEAEKPVTFEDILEEFKEGVLENIEDEDFDSHYDLGITYKEMGLIDEAILEFEKSSKGENTGLKSFEMLCDCLMDKGDLAGAEEIVKQALEMKGHKDIDFLGLKYNLANIYENTNKNEKAIQLFSEIINSDESFMDAATKLKELQERTKKPTVGKKVKKEEAKKELKESKKAKEEKKEDKKAKITEKSKQELPKEKAKVKRKKKISYI